MPLGFHNNVISGNKQFRLIHRFQHRAKVAFWQVAIWLGIETMTKTEGIEEEEEYENEDDEDQRNRVKG